MTALTWIGVALLGGVGSCLRFLIDKAMPKPRGFPSGILLVNLSGALVLGLLSGLALDHRLALLAGTATVGAYTTFSTWMFDSVQLGTQRRMLAMAANIGGSLVLGLGAAMLGTRM